jgi:uncharacterized protein (DUF924 family)
MTTEPGGSLAPADVLGYWFTAQPADLESAMPHLRRWFEGGPEFDREIIDRFGTAVAAAVEGGFAAWETTPRDRLALILLLDQFTRNVYRGDSRTYAGDARAVRLAVDALDNGLDHALTFWERLFLTMPLRHSEDLAMQRRGLDEARRLLAEAPDPLKPVAAMGVEQSEKYTTIVERFGHFPHRNEILARPSTAEEQAFLSDWQEKAPPRVMADDRANRKTP